MATACMARWVLGQFGKHTTRAREQYARFVAGGAGECHREAFHRGSGSGPILGDDRFAEEAMARAGRRQSRPVALKAVIEVVCAEVGVSEQELAAPGERRPASHARAFLAWLVRQQPELSLQALANRLGRDISSLSGAATGLEQRITEDAELKRTVHRLKTEC